MSYEGAFEEGKFSGKGVLTFADGSIYKGNFKDNQRNGSGTLTDSLGDRFFGKWKGGKKNGVFTIQRTNGTEESVRFADDVLVEQP
jgi:hypothetical protein